MHQSLRIFETVQHVMNYTDYDNLSHLSKPLILVIRLRGCWLTINLFVGRESLIAIFACISYLHWTKFKDYIGVQLDGQSRPTAVVVNRVLQIIMVNMISRVWTSTLTLRVVISFKIPVSRDSFGFKHGVCVHMHDDRY